jgi:uncharacterized protein YggE
MRRTVAALTLAALLVTAGCSAPLGLTAPDDGTNRNPDAAPDGDADRTIRVTASGTAEAEPDRAVVRVSVVARSDDVATVRDRLAANASQLREALTEAGIDAEQVVTSRYGIQQNYRHDPERRPEEPQYRGQHAFTVTLGNTSRAGATVVTALENGATRVGGVEYTLTEETRRDLRNEALDEAVAAGREQAETAANRTALSITGVASVETAETSVRPYRVEGPRAFTAAAGDGGGGTTSFEGGTVTVTSRALVTYNATSGN